MFVLHQIRPFFLSQLSITTQLDLEPLKRKFEYIDRLTPYIN
jgi:hypothetical protein